MASKLNGVELTKFDDLFKTEDERQADRQERIQIVPAEQIFPYFRQPYTVDRPTPDLVRLMDSIEQVGIAEPLIVRPREAGGYEIISGHRRDYCGKAVGLDTRPVIVRNYSDEEADILVVDYNINREDLLPSEKAKAYKLKLDAMKRQAGRPSKNSLQFGEDFRGKYSVRILAEQVAENVTSIQRYIRLNKLIPPLLNAVDTGTLKFVPAADYISHLSEKEQTYAALRGTLSETTFAGEVPGSDKRFSFAVPVQAGSNPTLCVFEAAIDALSYLTLLKLRGRDWHTTNTLSLVGVYHPCKDGGMKFPSALEQYLKSNPHLRKIILCLDNDEPGWAAAKAIAAKLTDYEVVDNPPHHGKDYNDQLRLSKSSSGKVKTRGGEER